MSVTLRDKFRGCIAGCHIGSAMGAVTEGMDYSKIIERYGFLDKLVPYQSFDRGWMRPAGMTEDGVERQRLMVYAIIDKQDRITAEDLRAAWCKYANPAAIGTLSIPFEAVLFQMAASGIPAKDLGRYCDYAGLNSFARACHPVALINAGNIKTAIEDILEVGQLYQTTNSRGLKWACVTGVAIAAATKPNATVDSVIGAIYDNCDANEVVPMIEKHIEGSKDCKDITELRKYYDNVFSTKGVLYSFASAEEVVTKGITIFKMVKGNTKEAILAGTNMGRDTDCVAALGAGISGALTGTESIPQEWFDQVDEATRNNEYTCSRRTIHEDADAIYDAFKSRVQKEKAYVNLMDIA